MSKLTPHRVVWPLTGNNCVYCGLKPSADVHIQQPDSVKSYGSPCGLVYPSDESTQLCDTCGFPEWQHKRTAGPCGLRVSSDVSTQLCGTCGFPEWQHQPNPIQDARKNATTILPESPDTAMARRAIKRAIETLKWALDDLG